MASGAKVRWLSLGEQYAHRIVGGTETYVHRLNTRLRQRGVDVTAAYFGSRSSRLALEEIPIIELVRAPRSSSRMEEWSCRPEGLAQFQALLDELRPSVVHFNGTFQSNPSEYFDVARKRGAKVVLTYHAPGLMCMQTALLENGKEPCDGKLDPQRCARCGLVWLGLPEVAAQMLSRIDLHRVAEFLPRQLGHPLERRRGTEVFQQRVRDGIRSLDIILTSAAWARDLLVRNGVPTDKLVELQLSPPNNDDFGEAEDLWDGLPRGLRLLFAGRLIDIKGVHVLMEAFSVNLRAEPNIGLVILGAQGDTAYAQKMYDLAATDRRVRIAAPRDLGGTLAAMCTADAVVVPSIWLETGPYTVLESQWVGTPVIGTRLGGIAERLAGDMASRLFARGSASELADSIRSLRQGRIVQVEKAERARTFREKYSAAFERQLDLLIARVS